jgi:hypothetical protein
MTTTLSYTIPADAPVVSSSDSTEGTYTHNPNHVAEAQAHLIDFFRKPRNKAVVGAVASESQELEDAIWAVFNGFDVDTAVGHQLDLLGYAVGELRNDRTDADFRAAVKTRILVNSSEGSLEELIAICVAAVATIDVEARELYPAHVYMRWTDAFAGVTPKALKELLVRAKPAGVGLHAVRLNTTTGFRFSTVAAAGGASTKSFSSVAGGNGGLLEEVW